jgi:hypothetical protein
MGGNYWSPGWGDSFAAIVGVPGGALALPSGFDSGDRRMLVATPQGLLSYDPDTKLLSTLIANPLGGAVIAVASAGNAPQTGAFAITSSKAFSPSAPQDSATAPQGSTVWICPPRAMCKRTATFVNVVMWQVSVSPNFAVDHTLSVDSGTAFLVSHDGGGGFSTMDAPSSVTGGQMTVATNGAGGVTLWLAAQLRSQTWAIFHSDTLGQSWSAVAANRQLATEGGTVVAVSADRTIVELPQGGMLCSVNNGATWASRCPAA